MALEDLIGDRIARSELMSKHTTFGIGGPADLFVVAHTMPELCNYVRLAWEHQVPYFILGQGANLLVADKGIRGLVIQNRCAGVEIVPADGDTAWLVKAESGAALRAVARRTAFRGLAGLEWAIDVPGTVGGAVVGNAGAYGGYVSDSLQGVVVLSPEEGERWWPAEELELGYRSSLFKKKTAGFARVILSATFVVQGEEKASIRERMTTHSRYRAERQPEGLSAGSVFKRTPQYPAGFLIENAGLKGRRVGGAIVSPKHANFIINLGTAKAQDVRELIEIVRTTVHEEFKIALELEIDLIGDW